jgi:hypothetical protein
MLEQNRAVLHKGDGGVKRMRAAGKLFELGAGRRAIGRLGETLIRERQSLVGAKNKPARMPLGDKGRLLARQQTGNCDRIVQARLRFYPTLVDIGRKKLDRHTGGFEQRAARGTARRQHQGSGSQPQRHR